MDWKDKRLWIVIVVVVIILLGIVWFLDKALSPPIGASYFDCDWCGTNCVKYPVSEEDCKASGGIFDEKCICPEIPQPEDFICSEDRVMNMCLKVIVYEE